MQLGAEGLAESAHLPVLCKESIDALNIRDKQHKKTKKEEKSREKKKKKRKKNKK